MEFITIYQLFEWDILCASWEDIPVSLLANPGTSTGVLPDFRLQIQILKSWGKIGGITLTNCRRLWHILKHLVEPLIVRMSWISQQLMVGDSNVSCYTWESHSCENVLNQTSAGGTYPASSSIITFQGIF